VVPDGTYHSDPALNALEPFSRQWRDYDPPCRAMVRTTIQKTSELGGALRPEHYNDLIQKMVDAAKSGTGVVFIATGHEALPPDHDHRRPGPTESGWIYLAPEDRDQVETDPATGASRRARKLAFSAEELIGYDVKDGQAKPPLDTWVRLNALDRLCKALHPTGSEWRGNRPLVRRLVVHSCRSGRLAQTLQCLANRVQVPVVGHLWYLLYGGLSDEEYAEHEGGRVRGAGPRHEHTYAAGYERQDLTTRAPISDFDLPDALDYLQNKYLGEVHYSQHPPTLWDP
jgi:hypothetical protein